MQRSVLNIIMDSVARMYKARRPLPHEVAVARPASDKNGAGRFEPQARNIRCSSRKQFAASVLLDLEFARSADRAAEPTSASEESRNLVRRIELRTR